MRYRIICVAVSCFAVFTTFQPVNAELPKDHGTNFHGFQLDPISVPKSTLIHSGLSRDKIPPLNDPATIPGAQQSFLAPDDRIVGVVVKDKVRAYPLKMLAYHQVINDQLAGVPVAVTYCPLTDAAMVFERRKDEETSFNFAASGILYNSNLLMFETEAATPSLWSQLSSRAIAGPHNGRALKVVSSEVATWRDWLKRYGSTWLISDRTPYTQWYNTAPYASYYRSAKPAFAIEPTSDKRPPKDRVLGVWTDQGAEAFPLSELAGRDAPVTHRIGDRTFTVRFDRAENTARIIDADEGVQAAPMFWYAWYGFHADTEVFHNRVIGFKPPVDNKPLTKRTVAGPAAPAPAVRPQDAFGNPIGPQFGFARANEFAGRRILVWSTEGTIWWSVYPEDNPLWVALRAKGFEIERRHGSFDVSWLNRADQIWIFASPNAPFTPAQLLALDQFVQAGRGVYVIADNDPFVVEAKQLAMHWFNAGISGNYEADRTVRLIRNITTLQPSATPTSDITPSEKEENEQLFCRTPDLNHPVLTDIDVMYEGWTVSHIDPSPQLMPILLASDGKILVACARNYQRRIVIDCGWTRYYRDTILRKAGTVRFAENIAAYLAGKPLTIRQAPPEAK